MSLSIEDVILTLKALKLPADLLVKAETQLEAIEQEKKEEAAGAPPKAKTQLVTILLDPEGKLKGLGDFVSLVVQVPEADDAGLTLDKMHQAVYDYRAKAKKPKMVHSLADAVYVVKRKFFKESGGVVVRTRIPVRTLVSNNQIPVA